MRHGGGILRGAKTVSKIEIDGKGIVGIDCWHVGKEAKKRKYVTFAATSQTEEDEGKIAEKQVQVPKRVWRPRARVSMWNQRTYWT